MNGIKADPDVKMDHDAITPSGSGYMDDDFYEDTGELALPPKNQEKDVWITRIPKYLYDAISNYDELTEGRDDELVVLGEVLALRDPQRPTSVSKTEPIRVILNHPTIAQKQLPQAFDLKMAPAPKEVLGNTYVFTEKDLPGYKPGGYGQGRQGSFGGVQDPKARVGKRSKYKKAIPKQTALVGSATREYTANFLNTKEYKRFNEQQIKLAVQGREEKTNISDSLNDHSLNLNLQRLFKSFIKPAGAPRAQANKAARIPRNELIDLLHQCFDEYKYWPMKALKARTKQPEAYLKEVLQEIAMLVKSGTFASTWKRQGVYDDREAQDKTMAPGGEDGDDDDEEMEMEDVI